MSNAPRPTRARPPATSDALAAICRVFSYLALAAAASSDNCAIFCILRVTASMSPAIWRCASPNLRVSIPAPRSSRRSCRSSSRCCLCCRFRASDLRRAVSNAPCSVLVGVVVAASSRPRAAVRPVALSISAAERPRRVSSAFIRCTACPLRPSACNAFWPSCRPVTSCSETAAIFCAGALNLSIAVISTESFKSLMLLLYCLYGQTPALYSHFPSHVYSGCGFL